MHLLAIIIPALTLYRAVVTGKSHANTVSQARKSADYRDHYFNYLYHFCRHSLCNVPQLYHRRIWLGTKGQHNPSCDGKNYEYQQFDG